MNRPARIVIIGFLSVALPVIFVVAVWESTFAPHSGARNIPSEKPAGQSIPSNEISDSPEQKSFLGVENRSEKEADSMNLPRWVVPVREGTPALQKGYSVLEYSAWLLANHDPERSRANAQELFRWMSGIEIPRSAHSFGLWSFKMPPAEMTAFYDRFLLACNSDESRSARSKWETYHETELDFDTGIDPEDKVRFTKGSKHLVFTLKKRNSEGDPVEIYLCFDVKHGVAKLEVKRDY